MSGKKDKESRRLTKSLNTSMKKHLKHLEGAKKIDHAKVIATYNLYLRKMNYWKKVKFAFSLLTAGMFSWILKNG